MRWGCLNGVKAGWRFFFVWKKKLSRAYGSGGFRDEKAEGRHVGDVSILSPGNEPLKRGMHDSMKESGGGDSRPTHAVCVGPLVGTSPDYSGSGNLHQIIQFLGTLESAWISIKGPLPQTRVGLHDSDFGKTHWAGCCAPRSYQN